jgi:hypothetical protein
MKNTLQSSLHAARSEYNQSPPAAVELALRSALRRQRSQKRLRQGSATAAAIAAALVGLLVASHRELNPPQPQPEAHIAAASFAQPPTATKTILHVPAQRRVVSPRRRRQAPKSNAQAPEFVAIPYTEPLLATDRIDVYRVQMPRATLASFGLPLQPNSLNATVTADLLVGSDGIARAVHFVR